MLFVFFLTFFLSIKKNFCLCIFDIKRACKIEFNMCGGNFLEKGKFCGGKKIATYCCPHCFLSFKRHYSHSHRQENDAPGSARPSTIPFSSHKESHDLRCQHILVSWSATPPASINSCIKVRVKTDNMDGEEQQGAWSFLHWMEPHGERGMNLMFA